MVQIPNWSEVKVAQLCLTLLLQELYSPWNSPGQNTGVGSLFLLQRIFPTQGSNSGLPHCRRILYQLSHKGSPRMWVAYPFSRGSYQPRNQTGVSCITGGFFPSWATREADLSRLRKKLSEIIFLLCKRKTKLYNCILQKLGSKGSRLGKNQV